VQDPRNLNEGIGTGRRSSSGADYCLKL
jgi:hypothetical protein